MATFIQVAVKNAKPLTINADNIEYIIDHPDGSAQIYFSSDNSVIVQVNGAEIAKLAARCSYISDAATASALPEN